MPSSSLTQLIGVTNELPKPVGGEPFTFSGLAGMGDLVATCTSDKSRNRTVGVALGQGRALDEIVTEMRMVAEGVKSTAAKSAGSNKAAAPKTAKNATATKAGMSKSAGSRSTATKKGESKSSGSRSAASAAAATDTGRTASRTRRTGKTAERK